MYHILKKIILCVLSINCFSINSLRAANNAPDAEWSMLTKVAIVGAIGFAVYVMGEDTVADEQSTNASQVAGDVCADDAPVKGPLTFTKTVKAGVVGVVVYYLAKDAVRGAQALKSYYFPSAAEIRQAEDARVRALQTRERLNMLLAKKRFREALFGNVDGIRDQQLGIPIASLDARRELLQNGGVAEAAELVRIFIKNFPQRAPDAPRYNLIRPVSQASRCIIS